MITFNKQEYETHLNNDIRFIESRSILLNLTSHMQKKLVIT